MVTRDEATKAATTLWEYMRQYENKPTLYQQSGSVMVTIRISQIKDIMKNMKKKYKKQIKKLEKAGEITNINDREFYYNDWE